jgi:hypothetical protein
LGHRNDWEAELPMLCQEITLQHPLVSGMANTNGWTSITAKEIGELALANNFRVLVY